MKFDSLVVNGSLIDKDNEDIKDHCFLALLDYNDTIGEDNVWFLGAPIINDFYTVFDMSPYDEHSKDYI